MNASEISPAQARLKIAIFSKQAEAQNSFDFHARMRKIKLPEEIVGILEKLLKITAKVTGKVISIGKIIVVQLLDYVAKHPLQVAGLAVGLCATYALGIALHGLFALVPELAKWKLIGGLLSKLALSVASLCKTVFVPLMAISPLAGAIGGEVMDSKYPEVSESLKKTAKDFFELFSRIMNAIKDELRFDGSNFSFA